ncbi:TetR family transcriptional regulator [Rhizobiales bacterium RZME27]|jgi:AcrR family transcriptional regulator|uniref:TetR family transcriptional regulator n=1 Tax=Endobacterium cereale TaxID=2663029 RepID=A0A6A8A6F1_9HYPH|nr:TetR/AcrR family transcriptional regulator [Endobacterium cereale]MEB2846797.1 TetR/AcrR family transcriptional regulator [Endobacterium cereale]MQY45428.1 TetR family transcriptional regulator [Endobacterium cereale]
MDNTAAPAAGRTRRNDPDKTKQDILAVATAEFAEFGLAGARIDAIAEKTRTSKRMIYYYFGGKEELYLAVLERAYQRTRSREDDLQLAAMPPADALRELIHSTFDYDEQNPDFIRIVIGENINNAMHMKRSAELNELNISVIRVLDDILCRGYRDGVFCRRIDPLDLHMMISALCFFRVSNRHTFGALFRCDLSEPETYERHRRMAADTILAYLTQQA